MNISDLPTDLKEQLSIHGVAIVPTRDDLLTPFGKATLHDRYQLPGEDPQDVFARVASYYGSDDAHAARLYEYISKLWFMPATPVLSNGGTDRGMPVSCFLGEATDNLEGIVDHWVENVWLAAKGGGIGCVDADTEYLTPNGWRKISDYRGEEIMTVSEDGRDGFFARPDKHISGRAGRMFRLSNSITDMVVSENHRNFVRFDGKSRFGIKTTDYLVHNDRYRNARFKPYVRSCGGEGVPYTQLELRFLVALAADGANLSTGHGVRFAFRRFRKIERMRWLAAELDLDYTETTDGVTTTFTFREIGIEKRGLTFANFGEADTHQLDVIYDELGHWDGSFDTRTGNLNFHTAKSDEADFVQYVIMSATERRASIGNRRGDEYVAHETGERHSTVNSCEDFVPADGKQYCFTTSTGLWLARRNGFVFVTGNSYWGNLRSLGENVGRNGKTSGVIPFIRVMDSLTLAISQGCVDGDTEILTAKGWVKFADFKAQGPQLVWQVDNTGKASLTTPTEYHEYDYKGIMHRYVTHGLDGEVILEQFVTPNHRMVKYGMNHLLEPWSKMEVFLSEDYAHQAPGYFVRMKDFDTSGVWPEMKITHEMAPFVETTRTEEEFDGKVYCVTVDTGMFIVRKNGTMCVTGNSLRRGSAAVYLPVWHPEIEEFIEIRRPTGGDPNRKALNLHHGVIVSDAFMHAVENDEEWELLSPKDGSVVRKISARALWIRILTARLETGEPYILFEDTIRKHQPKHHVDSGLVVKTSNLCVHGDTRLMTDGGYRRIADLAGQDAVLWNGKEWSLSRVEQTAEKAKLRKIVFSNGAAPFVTDEHKFYIQNEYHQEAVEVRASELRVGDRLEKWDLPVIEDGVEYKEDMYASGFMSADGTYARKVPLIWVYPNKRHSITRLSFRCKKVGNPDENGRVGITYDPDVILPKFTVPSDATLRERIEWLSGYLDGDGSVARNGENQSLQFCSVNAEFLDDIRLMLTTMGIDCSIGKARDAGDHELPDGKGGTAMFPCKTLYRGCISSVDTQRLLDMGLLPRRLELVKHTPQRSARRFVTVVSNGTEFTEAPTFCANEPKRHRILIEGIETGNCAEITLPTGIDHHGKMRTAVCCLSSLNLETWEEWHDNPQFIRDVMEFLDNVLQDFIDRAPNTMEHARYSAMRERSVGLGVMGFHSFLQKNMIPFGSVVAKVWNRKFFKHIRAQADAASRELAILRGPCPDAAEHGVMERFSHKMAVAPTASISIIAGGASPGIEPYSTNATMQKTLSGSSMAYNKYLKLTLAKYGMDTPEVWSDITVNKGSCQHLDFLSDQEREVFKTAFEIDQRWIIELAGDRAPLICQAQSINIFLPADVHKSVLLGIHWMAWKHGVKSLYYCRSLSIRRSDAVGRTIELPAENPNNFSECLACQ